MADDKHPDYQYMVLSIMLPSAHPFLTDGEALPTQDSRDIIAAACRALNHVWREGYRYMKAGVMLADFTPSGIAQPGLFDEIQPRKNSEKLMKTLDELNQSGKGKVWFAGRGTAPEWQMKREMLSPSYTTQWTEIPIASF